MLAKDTLGNRMWDAQEMMRFSMETVSPPQGGRVLARPHSADCLLLMPKEFAGAPFLEHCLKLIASPVLHSPRLARGGIQRRERLGNTGRKKSPLSLLADRQELLACPHGMGLESQVKAEARVHKVKPSLGCLARSSLKSEKYVNKLQRELGTQLR